MPTTQLEEVVSAKVKPMVEEAMQKYLGVTIAEIESDISDRIKKSPMLEISTSIPFKKAKREFKKAYLARLLRIHAVTDSGCCNPAVS